MDDPNTLKLTPPPDSKHRLRVILYGITGLLMIFTAFGSGYFVASNKQPNPQTQSSLTSQQHSITPLPTYDSISEPNTNVKKRVTLIPGYYLDVTVPKGYHLRNGEGDYAAYLTTSEGKDLIGFQRSWGGGELSLRSPITIDGVPMSIMYRDDIGCPADIFSEKANSPGKMAFGILTWCEDENETQLPVYKQVIDSVVFGDKLRNVLLGNEPQPSLN